MIRLYGPILAECTGNARWDANERKTGMTMNANNRGMALSLMAGAGALIACAGSAQADVVVASSPDSGLFSTGLVAIAAGDLTRDEVVGRSVAFSQFDSSLGTLTSVTFSLDGYNLSDSVRIVISGNEGFTGSVTSTATFKISGPGPQVLFEGSPTPTQATASCSGHDPNPCDSGAVSPATLPTFATPVVLGTGLAPFIGGATFDLDVELTLSVPLGTSGIGPGFVCTSVDVVPTQCDVSARASWAGGLTVTYTYEPVAAAVPEPTALGLFATGLIAVGVLTRRRRRID